MSRIRKSLLFFVFLLLVSGQLVFSNVIERLDAQVVRANPEKNTLTVRFENPVSGEKTEKEFLITNSTSFKRVKSLKKIKEGDLVTIDYRDVDGKATAVYVDVVPIDRQVVSAGEMASSLVKIKSR